MMHQECLMMNLGVFLRILNTFCAALKLTGVNASAR
jgi:hypothetical protein